MRRTHPPPLPHVAQNRSLRRTHIHTHPVAQDAHHPTCVRSNPVSALSPPPFHPLVSALSSSNPCQCTQPLLVHSTPVSALNPCQCTQLPSFTSTLSGALRPTPQFIGAQGADLGQDTDGQDRLEIMDRTLGQDADLVQGASTGCGSWT